VNARRRGQLWPLGRAGSAAHDRAGPARRPMGRVFPVCGERPPRLRQGANWIPAHSLVAGLDASGLRARLRSAAAAHMNMIASGAAASTRARIFYDLCDELGLLVWQDFMFACTLYPADARVPGKFGALRRRTRSGGLRQPCLPRPLVRHNEVFGCNADLLAGEREAAGRVRGALPSGAAGGGDGGGRCHPLLALLAVARRSRCLASRPATAR